MNALFLVPRGAEANAVKRAGARVVELPAGARAVEGLPDLLAAERIIVAGLCGALQPLPTQAVVVYDAAVDGERWFSCDASLAASLSGAQRVVGYTSATVVTSAQEKRALAMRTGAHVVDMEGTPLAAALAARGLRFAIVRVVSDDAQHDLPPIDTAIDASGTLRPGRLALAFARAPLAAGRFVRESLGALRALERTAREIIALPG
jgi:nucleoside phosphorylase